MFFVIVSCLLFAVITLLFFKGSTKATKYTTEVTFSIEKVKLIDTHYTKSNGTYCCFVSYNDFIYVLYGKENYDIASQYKIGEEIFGKIAKIIYNDYDYSYVVEDLIDEKDKIIEETNLSLK